MKNLLVILCLSLSAYAFGEVKKSPPKQMWENVWKKMDEKRKAGVRKQCKSDVEKKKKKQPACLLIACGEGDKERCQKLNFLVNESTQEIKSMMNEQAKKGLSPEDFKNYEAAGMKCKKGIAGECNKEMKLAQKGAFQSRFKLIEQKCLVGKDKAACAQMEKYKELQKKL
ncbi:hypothetical protein OAB57_01730 [Bacteriovoracaceae bacterium]|nr:hypothetical protein [Bacteriovoracaceae bacterium]